MLILYFSELKTLRYKNALSYNLKSFLRENKIEEIWDTRFIMNAYYSDEQLESLEWNDEMVFKRIKASLHREEYEEIRTKMAFIIFFCYW